MLPEQSRTKISAWIKEGHVQVDSKVRKPSFHLEPGMYIELEPIPQTPIHNLEPAKIPLDIRYEDEYLLVVNKQRGLATHPAPSLKEPSLVNALLARSQPLSSGTEPYRPGIVHRLDKDTTGLLLVAKNDHVHRLLAHQIQVKHVERHYTAYVWGFFDQKNFTVQAPIARHPKNRLLMTIDPHGKPAVTHFEILRELHQGTLLKAKLETGRTHQIRVHLSSIGHPIKGDRLYAKGDWAQGPLRLHAKTLKFCHPVTKQWIEITAEEPQDYW
jgi:23S rRNA pseudouridine1911/1915/1917 synthase